MAKKRKKRGSGSWVSVKELLELLPAELLDELSKELSVDKWVKKLKAEYLFKLVLFSILNHERLSLRLMEANFEDPVFRALAPALAADEVTWTGIRERLIQVDSTFFRKLYEEVYQKAKALYGEEGLNGYHIKRYDSTMIATFSYLLEGMKVGNTKKGKTQVKLTAEFSAGFLIQMKFFNDQAHLSEERALKQVIQQANSRPNDIHVFDKGLKSRDTFDLFSQTDTLFVTRVAETPRYELIRPCWQDDGQQDTPELDFLQDSIVKLYKSGHTLSKQSFRLIQYHVKGSDKTLSFVTNILDLPATDIALVYRKRWDIEVLFRFMKQEMNLTHFVSNQLNAIQVMLYCTLIASMLVLIYKTKNQIQSYKKAKIRFFKELLYTILLEALDNPNELQRLKTTARKFIQLE